MSVCLSDLLQPVECKVLNKFSLNLEYILDFFSVPLGLLELPEYSWRQLFSTALLSLHVSVLTLADRCGYLSVWLHEWQWLICNQNYFAGSLKSLLKGCSWCASSQLTYCANRSIHVYPYFPVPTRRQWHFASSIHCTSLSLIVIKTLNKGRRVVSGDTEPPWYYR